MEKSSVGRYILMFEPKYSYYQFAVTFNASSEAEITRVNKYSDIPYGKNSKKGVRKNMLGDIDKITTFMTDEREFFKQYIDPDIFNYSGGNLHKIFIGYKDAGKMKALQVRFNEPKLYNKTRLVEGSKIKDYDCISGMADLLTDPKSDFLNYVCNYQSECRNKYFRSVSDRVILDADNLRRCKIMRMSGGEPGLLEEMHYYENQLKDKLTSYKEFREMYLLRNKYIYELDMKKQKFEEEKRSIEEKKTSYNPNAWNLYKPEELPLMGEQLTFFDVPQQDNSKVKKLK